jgi:hypothetical protein
MKTEPESSTWGISGQVRKVLARFVLNARRALEDDFRRQLVAVGVRPENTKDPARELTADEAEARRACLAVIERAVAGGKSRYEAFETYIADCAFTFLNRMIGLRSLEERRMLLVDGQAETVICRDPRLGASSLYFRVRNELPADAQPREVWKVTLERAFQAVSQRVGLLFDTNSEYGKLLPLQATLREVVEGLNDPAIPPGTWGDDEVLGWVYQYYNSEEKDAVYDKLRAGGRIEQPEELAAATCLYTERYMVDYILQNTLGALWVGMAGTTELSSHWPYFVRSPEPYPTEQARELPSRLRDVTIFDPACGSGHFLARAFDLLTEMYREEGLETPEEIPHLILERNLHGLDIDLRAVQISALRLYLKACEVAGGDFRPRRMNLVSADIVLPPVIPGRLFERFRGDRGVQELIKAMWSELKDAPKLGSLLHPERRVDELLAERRRGGPTLEHQDEQAWQRYKMELLEGIRAEFDKETRTEDIARRLFGQELTKSVTLMEALSRQYDVVVTNPPYAGKQNLDDVMKNFVDDEYKDGKPDLYSAFIQRCIDLAGPGAFVGMVTQQSWLFLRSFKRLRQYVLDSATVTTLAHLGPRGFEEVGGEVVSVALFTFRSMPAPLGHRMTGFRVIGPRSPTGKNLVLRKAIASHVPGIVFTPKQSDIQAIPETPFIYWLGPRFFELVLSDRRLSSKADVRAGLQTSDNERFLRYSWEVPEIGVVRNGKAVSGRWFWYAKGGRYQKWAGLQWLVIDWEQDGQRIKDYAVTIPGNTHWSRSVRSPDYYFQPGLTYTLMASGSMGARMLDDAAFDVAGISVFPKTPLRAEYAALLNTRVTSYILRVTTQDLKFHAGYVQNLPMPAALSDSSSGIGEICVRLKKLLVKEDPTERSFDPAAVLMIGDKTAGDTARTATEPKTVLAAVTTRLQRAEETAALLHSIEGWNERLVCDLYGLDQDDVRTVTEETGTPAGWYPLISCYDHIPDASELPNAFASYFARIERKHLTSAEISFLKMLVREFYTAPSKRRTHGDEDGVHEDGTILGAHIPIPTETLLEELAQRVKIHPVSVLNMLKELQAEGGYSGSEVRRCLEDWASVVMLLMLGYRWPGQYGDEEKPGQAMDSDLVDADGIVPLVRCDDHPTAAELIGTFLARCFGEDGAAESLSEFRTWVGRDLTEWLERDFFQRHAQQFKQRPVAWHLTSAEGTFQALVLYHQLSRDTLRRLRDVYAGGLVNRLRGELQRAEERGDARSAEEFRFQIEDVEDFRARILAIEEGRELRDRIRCRWKGEEEKGRTGPYSPDLNDGVKVNIRPFQEAGLLSRHVIRTW